MNFFYSAWVIDPWSVMVDVSKEIKNWDGYGGDDYFLILLNINYISPTFHFNLFSINLKIKLDC